MKLVPDIGCVMEKKSKHIPFSVTSLIGMFDEAEIEDPRSQMHGQQDSSLSSGNFSAEDHGGNCGDSNGAPRANPVAHRGRIHRRSFSARDGGSDQSSEDHSTGASAKIHRGANRGLGTTTDSESEEKAPVVYNQPLRVAGGRRQPSGNVSRSA